MIRSTPRRPSESSAARSEFQNDEDWHNTYTVEKWKRLREIANGANLSNEQFEEKYYCYVEDCVYDAGCENEKALLQYIIRTVEPEEFKDTKGRLYQCLVSMFLDCIIDRLGDEGLHDYLHEAIKRSHFGMIKFICSEGKNEKLKNLIAEGIAYPKDGQNCLHAIIKTDPRNIETMYAMVDCATEKALLAKRETTEQESNGNTPLHEFVTFSDKLFKICVCACSKRCAKDWPDFVRDEHKYSEHFVKTLKKMIQICPEALYTMNRCGKTPFVVHRESRQQGVNDSSWNALEYDELPVPTDRSLGSCSSGSSTRASSPNKPNQKLQRSNTATQQVSIDKKGMEERGQKNSRGNKITSSDNPEHKWDYSKILAQQVASHLLEECCSLPSWEDAKKSVFGDQSINSKSHTVGSIKI